MIHLRKADNGEFYCNIIAKNGKETWRTSETYKQWHGAINAVYSLAKMFGAEWDGEYADHAKEITGDAD
jgi:uncharacterized protein YegP (UPF0339 family)